MSDPPLSDIDCKNTMGLVWTTLKSFSMITNFERNRANFARGANLEQTIFFTNVKLEYTEHILNDDSSIVGNLLQYR